MTKLLDSKKGLKSLIQNTKKYGYNPFYSFLALRGQSKSVLFFLKLYSWSLGLSPFLFRIQ